MVPRKMTVIGRHLLKKYPILTITGPRQSGKSTFAKMLQPGFQYVNLEDIDMRKLATTDPKGFLQTYDKHVIFNEVQNVPELLSQLQVHTDATGKNGMYILTGSQNFQLYEKIGQSLSGRTALCTLLPFEHSELAQLATINNWPEACWKGMYPRLYKQKIQPDLFYPDYITTYIERDTRQVMNIRDLNQFRNFLSLCAGRTGQVLNLQELGNSAGIDAKTVKQWLSLLQSSYIIYLLQPYYNNFNKRIIKAPKLYFYDTGIAAYLLSIRSRKDLDNHFARGALFENFIINDLMKICYNKKVQPNFYYFRDSNGNEVDLLIEQPGFIYAIECKSSHTIQPDFFKGLQYFTEISNKKTKGICFYGGKEDQLYKNFAIKSWKHTTSVEMK
jgi:uncharacterized protein